MTIRPGQGNQFAACPSRLCFLIERVRGHLILPTPKLFGRGFPFSKFPRRHSCAIGPQLLPPLSRLSVADCTSTNHRILRAFIRCERREPVVVADGPVVLVLYLRRAGLGGDVQAVHPWRPGPEPSGLGHVVQHGLTDDLQAARMHPQTGSRTRRAGKNWSPPRRRAGSCGSIFETKPAATGPSPPFAMAEIITAIWIGVTSMSPCPMQQVGPLSPSMPGGGRPTRVPGWGNFHASPASQTAPCASPRWEFLPDAERLFLHARLQAVVDEIRVARMDERLLEIVIAGPAAVSLGLGRRSLL